MIRELVVRGGGRCLRPVGDSLVRSDWRAERTFSGQTWPVRGCQGEALVRGPGHQYTDVVLQTAEGDAIAIRCACRQTP